MKEIPKMTRRQERAFNEGRMAFRMGFDYENCPLRSPAQRAIWRQGFDHERRLDLAEKVTPEQRAESESVASRLRDWVKQQREAQA